MRLPGCLPAAVCVLLLLTSALSEVSGQCSTTFTYNGITKTFQACATLGVAPGVSLAWTQNGSTLEVGFTGTAPSATNSWVGWGLNPSTSAGGFMDGATAFFAKIDAAGGVSVVVSNLNGDGLVATRPGLTTVPVAVNDAPAAAELVGTTVKLFASVVWSEQVVFHGWNSGRLSSTGTPLQHDLSQVDSKGRLNLTSGASVEGGDIPDQQLKYRHGILAAVSWGFLIPLGIMVARYARPFEACRPAWFYTHILVQLSGFILGVTAWGMGMKLGNASANSGKIYDSHNAIGIVVFTCSILQVLALVLRPDVENKKLRPFWNVYHHSVGYVAAVLGIVNIFIGFQLLSDQSRPKTSYRNGYIAVLAVLGGIAVVLEMFTWMVYFKRKSRIPSQKLAMGDQNGLNAAQNGHSTSSGYV